MKYPYPKFSNTLTFKRTGEHSVEATEHLFDESYTFGNEVLRFVKKLDGFTDPYEISTVLNRVEVDHLLDFLDENDLTEYSDVRRVSAGTFLKRLWIPKTTRSLRVFARFFNTLLLFLWLPILAIGIAAFVNRMDSIGFDYGLLGYFLGLLAGIFFHELGHALAGISYRVPVFEMGVMMTYFVLPGAYVLLDQKGCRNRFHRIQINAAGVESNFLLTGLFLIFGAVVPSLGGFCLNAALCNGFLGLVNLTLIEGLDGASVISELIGTPELIARTKKYVFNRTERRRALRRGVTGFGTVALSCLLFGMQLALPILLIVNVLEVVGCFV